MTIESGADIQRASTGASILALGTTLARLALIPPAVNSIREGDVEATGVWMGVIVGADIADGVLTRAVNVNADGPIRRVTDGLVDKVTALGCFASLASTHPETMFWYSPLAVRGVLAASQNVYNFVKKKIIIVGSGWHRLALLSQVGLGGALVADEPLPIKIVSAATAYSVNTLHTMSYRGNSYELEKSTHYSTRKISGFSGVRKFIGKN